MEYDDYSYSPLENMTTVTTSLATDKLRDLVVDPTKVSAVPAEAIPAMLGELKRLKASLWARLTVQSATARRQTGQTRKDWFNE